MLIWSRLYNMNYNTYSTLYFSELLNTFFFFKEITQYLFYPFFLRIILALSCTKNKVLFYLYIYLILTRISVPRYFESLQAVLFLLQSRVKSQPFYHHHHHVSLFSSNIQKEKINPALFQGNNCRDECKIWTRDSCF